MLTSQLSWPTSLVPRRKRHSLLQVRKCSTFRVRSSGTSTLQLELNPVSNCGCLDLQKRASTLSSDRAKWQLHCEDTLDKKLASCCKSVAAGHTHCASGGYPCTLRTGTQSQIETVVGKMRDLLFSGKDSARKSDATAVSIAQGVLEELERILDAYIWMFHAKRESLPDVVKSVRMQASQIHHAPGHTVSKWIWFKKGGECWSCSHIRGMAALLARHGRNHDLSYFGIRDELKRGEIW